MILGDGSMCNGTHIYIPYIYMYLLDYWDPWPFPYRNHGNHGWSSTAGRDCEFYVACKLFRQLYFGHRLVILEVQAYTLVLALALTLSVADCRSRQWPISYTADTLHYCTTTALLLLLHYYYYYFCSCTIIYIDLCIRQISHIHSLYMAGNLQTLYAEKWIIQGICPPLNPLPCPVHYYPIRGGTISYFNVYLYGFINIIM